MTDRNNNIAHPQEAIFPQATFPEGTRFAHFSVDIVTDTEQDLSAEL